MIQSARIWKERDANRGLYTKTFSGEGLISISLARSADFREILSRLNDPFVHPNPNFAYRDSILHEASSETLVFETSFFDRPARGAFARLSKSVERYRDELRPFSRTHLRFAQEQRSHVGRVARLGA